MSSDTIVNAKLLSLPAPVRGEVESWVVNSVKIKMIKKLDNILDTDGKSNARKLFLTPIFSVSEMMDKVSEEAPEIKTYFFRELALTIEEAEQRLT